jgi:hypothetical protein
MRKFMMAASDQRKSGSTELTAISHSIGIPLSYSRVVGSASSFAVQELAPNAPMATADEKQDSDLMRVLPIRRDRASGAL